MLPPVHTQRGTAGGDIVYKGNIVESAGDPNTSQGYGVTVESGQGGGGEAQCGRVYQTSRTVTQNCWTYMKQ